MTKEKTIILLLLLVLLISGCSNKTVKKTNADEMKNSKLFSENEIVENSNSPSNKEQSSIFNGFIFTVYAAGNETSYLSTNYMEDSTKIVLTPDIEISLNKFSLSMSSVPGLPFTIDISKDDIDNFNIDTIKVCVDSGELNNWNRDTGVVTSEGQSITIDIIGTGETIYWSPGFDAEASNTRNIQITVEAISDSTVIGKQNIYITQDQNGYYYATVGELELM